MTLKEFTKLAITQGRLMNIGNLSHLRGLDVARKMPEGIKKVDYLTKMEARHSNYFGKVREEYGKTDPLSGRIMKKGRRVALQPKVAPGTPPALGTVPGAY